MSYPIITPKNESDVAWQLNTLLESYNDLFIFYSTGLRQIEDPQKKEYLQAIIESRTALKAEICNVIQDYGFLKNVGGSKEGTFYESIFLAKAILSTDDDEKLRYCWKGEELLKKNIEDFIESRVFPTVVDDMLSNHLHVISSRMVLV